MNSALAEILAAPGPLILDGGLATELENLGADLNHSLWSARLLDTAPQLITRVHQRYYQAGARVATTATYQATIAGFVQQGYTPAEAEKLLHTAVELAEKARSDQPNAGQLLIAASLGPYGAYLADGSEYRGNYPLDRGQLRQFHEPRWRLLGETRADCFACETIPSLDEAMALTELAADYPQDYWISFSCCDDCHICDGSDIESAVKQVMSAANPPIAIGVNCTAPRYILPLVKRIRRCLLALESTSVKLLVYPNSGEQYDATDKCWQGQADVDQFVAAAGQWVAAGVDWIGGCCRTTPDHIQALATHFDGLPPGAEL
jgi:homocysteine S-methyltransferase